MRSAERSTTEKLRGGYYTPQPVADWLARWAIRSEADHVLEPCCGDGAFVAAAAGMLRHRKTLFAQHGSQLVAIELLQAEAEKARARCPDIAEVLSGDFFHWLEQCQSATFDVVLGNPPFIRYQNFPEPSRTKAMCFMVRQGLQPNRLTNTWVPFVVAATALLKAGGRFGMVLPAELLQVSYAAQLRRYLADSFERITIFACNEMFFDRAEQEVVLVAAEGKLPAPDPRNRCDISLVETSSVADLLRSRPATKRTTSQSKFVQHDSEKWLKYFLDAREIEFMRSLRDHPGVRTLAHHATVDIGVVTGRNEFFALTLDQVEAYGLHDFVVPLVGRSSHLSGAVLHKRELADMGRSGKRVYLLHLSGRDELQFTQGLRELLRRGESRGYHRGYKCSIRDPWYEVPAVWEPDCFFFRQIYDFPRVVVNRTRATSTDTIHRMRCRSSAARIAANVYTHLSAASAEIEGRSYGGGVLELEPTEAERLLVPRELNGALPIEDVDKLIRQGRLAMALEENDRNVLRGSLGMRTAECRMLKGIWCRMRDRRMARRRG